MVIEIKPLLDWLHLHPQWAGFAAFTISFIESIAIFGLFIPGSVTMTALGTLIGSSILPWFSTMAWASSGAILGDVFSFWLGYHYRENIHNIWPFHHYPSLIKQGSTFFQRYGGIGVFMGRFIGPIRPVLPLIAGMMSMKPARFLFADILSGIAWSPTYMLPGILIGAASQELAPKAAAHLILLVFIALLILWMISQIIKYSYNWIVRGVNHTLVKFWQLIKRHSQLNWVERIIIDPSNPNSPGQLGSALLFLIALSAFCFLTLNVYQHGMLTQLNIPMYHVMRTLRTEYMEHIMIGITFVGEASVMLPMWLAVLAWLTLRGNFRAAIHWFVLGILALAGIFLLKPIIHSPRPGGILLSPSGWSFPSGHATASTALFGFLAVLLATGRSRFWCWFAFCCAAFSAFLIIVSRIYLSAHWLTDVSGGILLGLSCLTFVIVSYRRKPVHVIAPLGVLLVAVLSLAIGWSWHCYKHYSAATENYSLIWPTYTVDATQWWAQQDVHVPLYRVNHFEEPIQILNLQWAGALPAIEQTLTQQGWQQINPTFKSILNEVLSNDPSKQQPILSELYQDRRPAMIMAKYMPNYRALLVIRLWDAHLQISGGQELWLGTLSFHKPWHNRFLSKNVLATPDITMSVTDLLTPDLKGFTWKQVTYPDTQITKYKKVAWDGKILLIK